MQQASPRKKAPEQVRQSILQHAICLAAEKGVTGVSIQAVSYTHLTLPTTPYV